MVFNRSLIYILIILSGGAAQAQDSFRSFHPNVPRLWVDEEMASLEVPLANPAASPKHVSAYYYYRIPIRPIYKQYAWYAPGHEPPGYMDWLKQREPEVAWGYDKDGQWHAPSLATESDWIKAGEIVFDATIGWGPFPNDTVSRALFEQIKPPVGRGGVIPFGHLVIRQKGTVDFGSNSCAMCHTRVTPEGTIIRGAQGNYPFDRQFAVQLAFGRTLEAAKNSERSLYSSPWLSDDPNARLEQMSLQEISALHLAIPPGVVARHRTSPFYPVHIPDLIGVKDRRYLDSTGLQRQRSIVDLMRYAALNQGADNLATYGGFVPLLGLQSTKGLPAPEQVAVGRYADEQLYALALFLYSLEAPPNPNPFDARAARGQKVFERERCAACHTPPLYTNNKLTPANGFSIPEEHLEKYDVLAVLVGTDPNLAMKTRRGTGYYKVPSLKGVWRRSMFEHNGSIASLEEWFDPQRLRDDYVPTGYVGPPGTKTRAVKGHEFGLRLSADDKRALITFLKTL
jgi:hypothetical protein